MRKNIKIINFSVTANSHFETVCVKAMQGNTKFSLINVYMTPECSINHYAQFFQYIEHISCVSVSDTCILLLGDFNLPLIEGVHIDLSVLDGKYKELYLFMNLYALKVLNNIKNTDDTTLDLVLSSDDWAEFYEIKRDEHLLVDVDLHHPLLSIEFTYTVDFSNQDDKYLGSYNFKKCNFYHLALAFRDANWSTVLAHTNVNDAVKEFYSITYNIFNNLVPKIKKIRNRYPVWFTEEIINCTKKKDGFIRLDHYLHS